MPVERGMTYHEAQTHADRDDRTLGAGLLRAARRRPWRTAVMDAEGRMSRIRLAGAALAIGPMLELDQDERAVGIMLPPGRGGTVVNAAVTLSGRIAVNLNHTAGTAQVERMCGMTDVRTIVTSSRYLKGIEERFGRLDLSRRVIHAERLIAEIDRWDVLRQMVRALVVPPTWIDPSRPDQVALVIFSSGTTGDPKGIQLTHRQIHANMDAVVAHMPIPPDRGALATPLPLFHSFGLVPGLWMAIMRGVTIAGQADPFDGTALGRLVHDSQATYMISTPTFARLYMRRVEAEQLASLDFMMVGAERCPLDLHEAFFEKYGVPLLEGYGCTELAPAVAINTLDGHKHGAVGRPLPGVEIVIMDPESGDLMPSRPDSEGLLVVRSAARMEGYLDRPDLTEEAFVHGGYNTGDVGHVDGEGFVHITGRLARFAKSGGEMIPLDHVEELLRGWLEDHAPNAECEVAVAPVPDRKKGERVVVLHTGELPVDAKRWLDEALADEPALWRPRSDDVYEIEEIPLLGTGTRDLATLNAAAAAVASDTGSRSLGDRARHAAVQAREGIERMVGQVLGDDDGREGSNDRDADESTEAEDGGASAG